MQTRVVLVPADARILTDPTTERLHTYSNGLVLVRTAAPVDEAGAVAETSVAHGVRLPGASEEDLDRARGRLAADVTSPSKTSGLTIADEEATSPDSRPGAILAYIELIGPPAQEWLARLAQLGLQLVHYQPENSYLARGSAEAFRQSRTEPFVLHVTPLEDVFKPGLALGEAGSGQAEVWIVAPGAAADLPELRHALGALPGVELVHDAPAEAAGVYVRLRAQITAAGQAALLADPRVVAVEHFVAPQPEDEVAGLIVAGQYDAANRPTGSYLRWLEEHGIRGAGVTIGIVDSGVDASHPAFAGRINALGDTRKSWHGTMVAGHAAGGYLDEKDSDNRIYGIGTAPAAALLVQDNAESATILCRQTVTETGPSGAPGTIQNNSWGKGTQDSMDYRSDEHAYDQLVRNADPDGPQARPLTVCFSAGNSGRLGLTRPKAAKNVLITGNSESYRPAVGRDQSDNINEVFATGPHPSSWGNCADGRIRPHLVAPGEWTASANFDSKQGEPEYISPRLTWGGGSSGASPKTAGACALLTEWWRRHNAAATPSPALLRAMIVNAAVPMPDSGPCPNRRQGWGRLNLEGILGEEVEHTFVDQAVQLTQLGQQKDWHIRVSDTRKPVRITLAWTDPPGALGSGTAEVDAIVNKLALRVEADGATYSGGWREEHFANGWSVAGPARDPARVDNLQNVFLPAGATQGALTISVKALSLTTNCLTGQVDTPQQDFALVITNGRLDAGATPADIFVVVDRAAPGPAKAIQPADFWAEVAGSSDADDLSANWWRQTDAHDDAASAARPAPGGAPDPGWWDATDFQPSRPEAERTSQAIPSSFAADAARGVAAGLELATAYGAHRLLLPAASHGGRPVEAAAPDASAGGAAELAAALAGLTSDSHTLGATTDRQPMMRRQVAVLVVGRGTRISAEDLTRLRRLALLGQLYLVSDHPPLLAFLAQRLQRRHGVCFRLTANAAELAGVVRDTIAEASGGQEVVLAASQRTGAAGLVSTYTFGVVPADRGLTVRLRPIPGAPIDRVSLQRPGNPPVDVDPRQPPSFVRLTMHAGTWQLEADAPPDMVAWAGEWRLELTQASASAATAAVVAVWARGGPHLIARQQTGSTAEDGRSTDEVLVKIEGEAGVTFTRSIIPPPRVATVEPVPVAEDEHTQVVVVPPSRLAASPVLPMARDGAATEAPREASLQSPSLAAWLRMPTADSGPAVLDVPLQCTGTDAHNAPFGRKLRANVVRLEPRSEWRRRVTPESPLRLVAGGVAEVQYAGPAVVGVRLRSGTHTRWVEVAERLREQLAAVGVDQLASDSLLLGVRANELVGVVRLLAGMDAVRGLGPEVSAGIDAPIPVPDLPDAEAAQTDYPLARRFVQALAYRHSPARRRIDQVVIHITDGGARADGTARWFQDPTSGVSAHYIVGQDGEVVQTVRDNDIAYHAHRANTTSIGIEHCARAPGAQGRSDTGLYPTPVQYAASAALVRWLCETYGIPIDRAHILGHAQADPRTTHAGCPDSVWDWNYFMRLVSSAMSLPPSQAPNGTFTR